MEWTGGCVDGGRRISMRACKQACQTAGRSVGRACKRSLRRLRRRKQQSSRPVSRLDSTRLSRVGSLCSQSLRLRSSCGRSESDAVGRLARCSARPSAAALRYAVSLIFPWTPPPPAPPLCIPGCRLPTMTSSLSAYFRSSRSTRRPSPTTAGETHAPVSYVCHAPYASARQYRFYRRFLPEKRDFSRWGFWKRRARFFSSAALRAPDIRAIASDLCDRARCLGLQSIAKCLPYTQLTPLDPTRRETALSRGVSSRRLEPCEVGCQTDVAGMS